MPTAQHPAASRTDYLGYQAARNRFSAAELVDTFPCAAEFERRLEEERNAGARIADDRRCDCGARGYFVCPSCQREANGAGR